MDTFTCRYCGTDAPYPMRRLITGEWVHIRCLPHYDEPDEDVASISGLWRHINRLGAIGGLRAGSALVGSLILVALCHPQGVTWS